MLADVSIEEVIKVMDNDKGTPLPMMRDTLKYYGIKTTTKTRMKYTEDDVLPDCCILSVKLPGYGIGRFTIKGSSMTRNSVFLQSYQNKQSFALIGKLNAKYGGQIKSEGRGFDPTAFQLRKKREILLMN